MADLWKLLELPENAASMRFEGGPRWGKFRLSLGVDFGFIFTPDRGSSVDMITLSAGLAGLTYQIWHVELHLNAFNLDLYLVPTDAVGNKEIEAWVGFNSGFSAAFFL